MRLLLVGPLPPPWGGDTVSFKNLVHSKLWEQYKIDLGVFDTSRKSSVRVGYNYTYKDIFRAIRMCIYFNKIFKYDAVFIACNSSFLWSIGIIFILSAVIYRKKIFIKPFGGSWDERFLMLPFWRRKTIQFALNRVTVLFPQTRRFRDFLDSEVVAGKLDMHVMTNYRTWSVDSDSVESHKRNEFVFIGQIKKEKGVFDLIESLKYLDDVRCDFYGPILPRDNEHFMNCISEIERVSYRGEISNKDVIACIRNYRALILPTFHEGEGIPGVIIESFAAARPVISTYWKSIDEIVIDKFNGLLCRPRSVKELSKCIKKMTNDELWNSLSCGAKASANRYTEDYVLGKVINVIHSKCERL